MDIEAVADELYGLLPGEFTKARDDAAKRARADGDPDAAAAISALRKPAAAAWAVNRLVRVEPEQVGAFLELGSALREAQEQLAGDELRRLAAERRKVIGALVTQAKRAAREAGAPISVATARQVEDTLSAALADPDAAEALAGGRLSAALQHTGLGPAGTVTPLRKPSRPRAAPSATGDSAAVTRSRRELERLRAAAQEAQESAAATGADAEAARTAQAAVKTEFDELARSLDEVRARLEQADGQVEKAERVATRAQREAAAAARRVEVEAERLERLIAEQ